MQFSFYICFSHEQQNKKIMYQIPTLPLKQDVETKAVLKQAAQAHRSDIKENLPGILFTGFTY